MTDRLYWQDPYRTTANATVLDVGAEGVVLDATIFHPRGGGQPGDTGTLGSATVVDTRAVRGGPILHVLDGPFAGEQGGPVTLALDWERRYAHMRHHTLLHLVHLAVQRTTGGVEPLGTDVGTDRARIEYPVKDPFDLPAIEQLVTELVAADLDVATTVEGPGRRVWRIAGWDAIPCGGTHVARLGEIGAFDLRAKSAGRRGTRLYVACRS